MAATTKSTNSVLYLFSLYFFFNKAITFNPLSMSLNLAYNVYNTVSCGWRECCTDEYISLNVTGMTLMFKPERQEIGSRAVYGTSFIYFLFRMKLISELVLFQTLQQF